MEKSDFKSYRARVREVQQIREQLRTLESSIYSPKGQRFSADPRGGSAPPGSAMAVAAEKHMQLVSLYEQQLAEKEAKQQAVELAIQSLTDAAERVVMRERYICGKEWPDVRRVMEKLGYSERTMYRLHGTALLRLKEV